MLLDLNEKFVSLVKERNIRVHSFGEMVKSTVGLGRIQWKSLLVTNESADPGVGKFQLLPSDHYGICKPEDKNATSYKIVHDIIEEILER